MHNIFRLILDPIECRKHEFGNNGYFLFLLKLLNDEFSLNWSFFIFTLSFDNEDLKMGNEDIKKENIPKLNQKIV